MDQRLSALASALVRTARGAWTSLANSLRTLIAVEPPPAIHLKMSPRRPVERSPIFPMPGMPSARDGGSDG
jgi:hypothetical protein